jgi:hypothetical protein
MALQPRPSLSFDDWLEGERAAIETRSEDTWTLGASRAPTEAVALASVGCTLALSEVYDKVDFEPV